jgi:Fe-S cluster assembly scaffold protein SufB
LLLISKEARGNALPVLEIYNGEVKAKHGETVSNISDEELIYLESRGMEPKKAKKLIIEGFVSPIISPLPPEISERYLNIVEDVIDDA